MATILADFVSHNIAIGNMSGQQQYAFGKRDRGEISILAFAAQEAEAATYGVYFGKNTEINPTSLSVMPMSYPWPSQYVAPGHSTAGWEWVGVPGERCRGHFSFLCAIR